MDGIADTNGVDYLRARNIEPSQYHGACNACDARFKNAMKGDSSFEPSGLTVALNVQPGKAPGTEHLKASTACASHAAARSEALRAAQESTRIEVSNLV